MRPLVRAAAVTLIVALSPLAPSAQADDRVEAAKHFQRAERAEKNGRFREAIAQYKKAYQLKPHPSVFYNIARNYEQLREYRNASTFYLRYLEGAPTARDRDEVLARVQMLRQKPGQVDIRSPRAGAVVTIDGKKRGNAPLTLTVQAGAHRAFATLDGRRSQPRDFVIEYGEPVTITFEFGEVPGTLSVGSNINGARVTIDGEFVGITPWRGPVGPGEHQVEVSNVGYGTQVKRVVVESSRGQVVRINLSPGDSDNGGEGGGEVGNPSGPFKFLIGGTFGFNTTGEKARGHVDIALRMPSDRFELRASYGQFGGELQTGFGAAARAYLAGRLFRPYLKGGVVFGGTDPDNPGAGRPTGVEGGVGLLYTSPARSSLAVEYFIEAHFQFTLNAQDEDSSGSGPMPRLASPLAATKLGFPIVFGLAVRFGG